MLDGCGIETEPAPISGMDLGQVAIDARWLWNRDIRTAKLVRYVEDVAIDARWLWNRDRSSGELLFTRSISRDRCSMAVESRPKTPSRSFLRRRGVAIDARWLWNRDPQGVTQARRGGEDVAIDARWLWNRDVA